MTIDSLELELSKDKVTILPNVTNLSVKPCPTINVIAGGILSACSTPCNASIYIDFKKQPYTTPVRISNISVGTHNLILKLPGYHDFAINFKISESKVTTICAALVRVGCKCNKQ